jgi:hypothetical protein
MNRDLGTTILGGIISAATAAMPVVEVTQGTWTKTSIFQLISAIGIAVFGFFTNRESQS